MAKLSESDRDKLPASKFAEPDKRAYAIEDAAHAKNAKARASQAVKAGRMSKAEESRIDKKADTVIEKDRRGVHDGVARGYRELCRTMQEDSNRSMIAPKLHPQSGYLFNRPAAAFERILRDNQFGSAAVGLA